MDRLLRPERFDTDSTDPNAQKLYRHWKMTFLNYLETVLPAADSSQPQDPNIDRKKLFALVNSVSASVFEIFNDKTLFSEAMQVLDATYIKPVSVVYNRHKLMTCQQEQNQSIDVYLQTLESLAKSCNFVAVTADENKSQYIRDAFINGLTSPTIRQRLLESSTLTLDEAYRQARVLEQAQQQSASYQQPLGALPETPENLGATTNSSGGKKPSNSKEKCYFCGNPRHPRANCPANNSICKNCQKRGHWDKVCKSAPVSGALPEDETISSLI